MNDYLCAVLLDETYNHQSKYNDIRGEGEHLKKDLKARILVVRSTGFSFAYKVHPFKVQRMTSIKSSLFAM